MVPLKRGRIINFASLLSFQGGFTVPAYASSKGGVIQLTKALSNEWSKEGVCVNAIAPGYIETEMNEKLLQDPVRLPQISERIPAGRWGRPEDFAGPVVFLASKASQYVCGEVLVVDGVSCSFSSCQVHHSVFHPLSFLTGLAFHLHLLWDHLCTNDIMVQDGGPLSPNNCSYHAISGFWFPQFIFRGQYERCDCPRNYSKDTH